MTINVNNPDKILVTYNAKDPDSVRKAYELINILKGVEVPILESNQFVNANKENWKANQRKHIEIIQDWGLDKMMIQDNKCLFDDKVYIIKKTHTVTDINDTPASTPTLYRTAPEIAAGRIYPLWTSQPSWDDDAIVDHNGEYWLSKKNNNTAEPGTVPANIWQTLPPGQSSASVVDTKDTKITKK